MTGGLFVFRQPSGLNYSDRGTPSPAVADFVGFSIHGLFLDRARGDTRQLGEGAHYTSHDLDDARHLGFTTPTSVLTAPGPPQCSQQLRVSDLATTLDARLSAHSTSRD